MSEKMKVADLPEFDMADYLDSDEAVAEYLTQVLTDGDSAELVRALGHIAKARGMAQIARDSGLGRESLYKALRPDAQPRFDTILRVCAALGVRLVAQPVPR
ncbi:addiction module antidote protein [Azohydromonas aeria]|uniref:addiction module antidote protein n=1 Tax=Azohydromonas aeria TaxID=2590212 RepID=UPI0012FA5BA2|nr:addiction module antidote protein [Azohydromonas aeria]